MDLFNWIFIIIMIIGFSTIIFAIVKLNKYTNATPISNVDTSIQQMKKTIDQADLAIDDLTLMSEQLFKRFDEKQKQLLFLYETIEKQSMAKKSKVDFTIDENVINKDMYENSKPKQKMIASHPMANKIKELSDKNMSVADIAKALNMGQGEVELILKFGKG